MKIRLFPILALLIFCTCCVKCCTAAPENTLDTTDLQKTVVLSIKLNKTIFALGEPIIATITVRNIGSTPVSTNWLSIDGRLALRLEVIDGTPIMMEALYGEVSNPFTHFLEPLKPGQAYTTAMDITRADIVESSPFFPRLAYFRDRSTSKINGYIVGPGVFKLNAIHVLDYTRTATSPPEGIYASTTFTIREPNQTEKEALKLFEWQPFFPEGQVDEAIKTDAEQTQINSITAFDKIWNSYRDTVYAPYALYYAARISQKMGDNSEAISRYTTLEKSCKDFPLMTDLLYYKTIALRDAGNKYEAMVVAQKLREKYWNHLVAPTIVTRRKGSPLRNMITDLEAVTSGAFKSMFSDHKTNN
jgi:hypothetical protein